PPAPAEPARARPIVAIEAGVDLEGRDLSFSGTSPAGTVPLTGFHANAMAGPRLRLELFPAARAAEGFLAGMELIADYRTSVGLKVKDLATGVSHPARFSRLEAGLGWRIPVGDGAVTPEVTYELLDVVTEAVSGAPIAGLPDAQLRGVRVAVGGEIPLGDRFGLLLSGGWIPWLQAQDLVKGSPPFFPGGSAWALEVEGGVSIVLGGPFSLRLLGQYSRTSYTLHPDPTGTYQATGATDAYFGGRAMVRVEL
ncbi:MAG TPA: hypothetical protein VML50_08705, partial [Anaeromyxobacter sp.]|nr:hypothetical protein [Anaeromyxobacter sp.]